MLKKTAIYCNILMALTGIHHIYGAYLYHTPWRLHVLAVAVPVLLLNWFVVRRKTTGKFLYATFLLVNGVMTIILIGFYEGVYNHLAKNILYFMGTNMGTMTKLFPPPTYVMPNDFLFEFTGILQAVVLVPLVYCFIQMIIWSTKNRRQINQQQ